MFIHQASYTVFHPNAYAKGASELSPHSGALEIDIYDASGNRVSIDGTSEPIGLTIPLDRNMPTPSKDYIHPLVPDRDTEYFFYQTTEITSSRASIQEIFRDLTPGKQLLVLVRLGGIQNLLTDFIHVCMIPRLMQYDGNYLFF